MTHGQAVDFAVLLPVGPGSKEVERARDTLESLWTYEPGVSCIVLIDDSPVSRPLLLLSGCPSGCEISILHNSLIDKARLGSLKVGILRGLSWIQQNTKAAFVLKIDTDSLVIGPFSRRVLEAFVAMPEVGMLGSYEKTCNGYKRDFSGWGKRVRKLGSRVSLWRSPVSPLIHVRLAWWGNNATIREIIRQAVQAGYQPGEHCQGGGYAVSRAFLDRMAVRGHFQDPYLWRFTRCPEDVMIGMYTKAVGMRLHGLVEEGQPFGIRWKGLAAAPDQLMAKGYSLIHSVKNDQQFSEAEIRRFFRERRASRLIPARY